MANKNHHWDPVGVLCGKWYCLKCGLFNLKNEASQKARDKPCPGAEQEDAPKVTMVKK